MKTKNKYFTVLILGFIGILVLLYKYNFGKNNISYISNNINENKIEEKIEKSELNVLFAGDIMLDRYIRKQINKYNKEVEGVSDFERKISGAENFVNNYLNNLSDINNKYDYVMANLEGPITENKSKSLNDDGTYGKDLFFTFPTSSVEILKLLNIKVVSLANNHTDNFYNKGLQDTKRFLETKNINYFGNPYNSSKGKLSQKICEKNICITYIGYSQFTLENGGDIIVKEIQEIKEDKENDFIIIMPHWGTEYDMLSNQKQKDLAHAWIDAGADMIVGAHPHVIQESEIYNSKYIYYSLGNYIFDQWFSADVQNGKVLDITFKKECELVDSLLGENRKETCKKEIKINKELKIFIDRNGVRYML